MIDPPGPGEPSSAVDRPLLTIGHSNHPTEHFLALLARHRVETVADVRSRPYSRFVPQYGRRTLADLLAGAGIGYLFLGSELGGKPRPGRRRDGSGLRHAHPPAGLSGRHRAAAGRRAERPRRPALPRARPAGLPPAAPDLPPSGAGDLDIRHILPDGSIEPQQRHRAAPAGPRRRAAARTSRGSSTRWSGSTIDGGIRPARFCLATTHRAGGRQSHCR